MPLEGLPPVDGRRAGYILGQSKQNQQAGVADEGGWWPAFDSNEAALDFLLRAIERAGYTPGQDVAISLDIAATDFGRKGEYSLARDGRRIDSDGLAEMLRAESARHTPLAWLSRAEVVQLGGMLVFALPGSPRAAQQCMDMLQPLLAHALAMLDGRPHP